MSLILIPLKRNMPIINYINGANEIAFVFVVKMFHKYASETSQNVRMIF